MSRNKISCSYCKAIFYKSNQATCGTCGKTFCPNCNACECTSRQSEFSRKIKNIGLKDAITLKENDIVEITATLSPLKGQSPVNTPTGTILKTEFELSDEHTKVPLIIWGPVPEKLFPFRYEYTNFVFSGLKKKNFNNKTVLVASKSTRYYANSLKVKPLDFFISESLY